MLNNQKQVSSHTRESDSCEEHVIMQTDIKINSFVFLLQVSTVFSLVTLFILVVVLLQELTVFFLQISVYSYVWYGDSVI